MGCVVMEVLCRVCHARVELVEGRAPLTAVYLCAPCGRHWSRWELDATEFDFATGEMVEVKATPPERPVVMCGPRFSYGAGMEWFACTQCGDDVGLLNLHGGGLVVIDRNGLAHRDWCPGMKGKDGPWRRRNAEQVDLELVGQLPLALLASDN